jgi:hypothetical protein
LKNKLNSAKSAMAQTILALVLAVSKGERNKLRSFSAGIQADVGMGDRSG